MIQLKIETLKPQLKAKVLNFLLNDKLGQIPDGEKHPQVWGMYFLRFGWSSPELKEYLAESASNDPFQFRIPENIRQSYKEDSEGFTYEYFQDYTNQFANEIKIREDDGLKNLILSIYDQNLGYDFEIEYNDSDLEGVSFYTDIQWLKKGIWIIFDGVKKRSEFPKVKVDLVKNHTESFITFKIIQIGSECKREIEDKRITQTSEGDWSTLKKCFTNLCDWSIEAVFPSGNYRVNYLSSKNNTPRVKELESKPDGFTHILKFYLK